MIEFFKQSSFNMYYNEEEENLIHNYEIVTGVHFLVKWVYFLKERVDLW